MSLWEAGEVCILAAVCAPNHTIAIARMDPEKTLLSLDQIAVTLFAASRIGNRAIGKQELVRMMGAVVPQPRHNEQRTYLDQRM